MKEFVTTCGFCLISTSVILLSLPPSVVLNAIQPKSDIDYYYRTSQSPETYYFSVKTYNFRNQFSFRLANDTVDRNTVRSGAQRKYDHSTENEKMENGSFLPRYSLLLQVLIFICCAAGVSAVLVLCCLICLHSLQFFSPSTVLVRDNRRPSPSSSYRISFNNVRIQRSVNNETVLTFVPTHRHPWSPGMANVDNERFTFPLEDQTDMPPSYDDLTSKSPEDVSSPLPPPYSPSFHQNANGQQQSTKFTEN